MDEKLVTQDEVEVMVQAAIQLVEMVGSLPFDRFRIALESDLQPGERTIIQALVSFVDTVIATTDS